MKGWEKQIRLQRKSKAVTVLWALMTVHPNSFSFLWLESKTTLQGCLALWLLLLGLDIKASWVYFSFLVLGDQLSPVPHWPLKPWPFSSRLGPCSSLLRNQGHWVRSLPTQFSHPNSLHSNWLISPPTLAFFHAAPENQVSSGLRQILLLMPAVPSSSGPCSNNYSLFQKTPTKQEKSHLWFHYSKKKVKI